MASSDRNLVIGIDLDNTIAGCDHLFVGLARGLGVAPPAVTDKAALRSYLRAHRPDGELLWQRLQAAVYGMLMHRAVPMPGVRRFLRCCRQTDGCTVYIVSHKTRFAARGRPGVDLRRAATAWLRAVGILEVLVDPSHLYFEDTREAKLRRIGRLGCTLFIDDLEEVLAAPGFPAGVERLLYRPQGGATRPGIRLFTSWRSIEAHLFSGLGCSP